MKDGFCGRSWQGRKVYKKDIRREDTGYMTGEEMPIIG